MLNKDCQAGTEAQQRNNDEVTTSSHTIGKPNVICSQSVYSKMPISTINVNQEISRWQSVIDGNKEGTHNYLENKERSISLIDVAEVNLEYLLSLSPDLSTS